MIVDFVLFCPLLLFDAAGIHGIELERLLIDLNAQTRSVSDMRHAVDDPRVEIADVALQTQRREEGVTDGGHEVT